MKHGTAAAYRSDIDGLRALAVLPVLLFHVGVPGFDGGYVGVDVFFVISGFLITGIIAREVDEGRFSLWNFYERRARRILPALFAVVAAVLLGASLLFLPGDFETVPPSAIAALGFVANIWFFSQAGYFHQASESMPLLHTWSLGVEEQFYIFFPLGLLMVARFAARWRVALILLAFVASLAWAISTQGAGDGFAFYMLPPRGWELMAGALLALGAVPEVHSRSLRELLSALGVAGILYATFAYDEQTVFPGVAAIPPVLGAALLVHCAPGTLTGKLLSWRPAVWVGLASYSLYLWHWPLVVFAHYAKGGPLAGWEVAAVVIASLMLAAASLRWIETPWRDRKRYSRRSVFITSGAGIAGLAAISLGLISLGPWAQRFSPAVALLGQGRNDFSPARDACMPITYPTPDPRCTLGAKLAPDALLWGDSHGVELAWVLGQQAQTAGRSLAQRTQGSCPPILDFAKPEQPDCALTNRLVMAEISDSTSIRTVYLAGNWAGGDYDSPATLQKLEATILRLQQLGKHVVFIGPVPTQAFDVPRATSRAAAYGLAQPVGIDLDLYGQKADWVRSRYPAWRNNGVEIIDPAVALFDGQRSRIVADGHALYFDNHHLTLAGARLVLDKHAQQ